METWKEFSHHGRRISIVCFTTRGVFHEESLSFGQFERIRNLQQSFLWLVVFQSSQICSRRHLCTQLWKNMSVNYTQFMKQSNSQSLVASFERGRQMTFVNHYKNQLWDKDHCDFKVETSLNRNQAYAQQSARLARSGMKLSPVKLLK